MDVCLIKDICRFIAGKCLRLYGFSACASITVHSRLRFVFCIFFRKLLFHTFVCGSGADYAPWAACIDVSANATTVITWKIVILFHVTFALGFSKGPTLLLV